MVKSWLLRLRSQKISCERPEETTSETAEAVNETVEMAIKTVEIAHELMETNKELVINFSAFWVKKKQLLLKAVLDGQCDVLEKLLIDGADPNEHYTDGKTALHHICMSKVNKETCVQITKLLLCYGAKPNARDCLENTPLILAAKNINCTAKLLSVLLMQNADPNAVDLLGRCPLHHVCMNKMCTVEMITELLRWGTFINVADSFSLVALNYACENKACSMDVFQVLLQSGADPKICRNGCSPLFFYMIDRKELCDISIVELLLKRGASQIISILFYKHILSYCFEEGIELHIKVIKKLLEYEINVNYQDKYHRTNLHYALKMKILRIDVIEELLNYGTDPNFKDEQDFTPLHYAVINKDCSGAVIRALLKHGALPNLLDAFNRKTPLHYAMKPDTKLAVVQELLKGGANPNLVDFSGLSPLHFALRRYMPDCHVFKEMFKHGANVNVPDLSGDTVLHYFAKYYVMEEWRYYNCDPGTDFCCDADLAESRRCVDVLKELISWRANQTSLNREGRTPLWIATNKTPEIQEKVSNEIQGFLRDNCNYIRFVPLLMIMYGFLEMDKETVLSQIGDDDYIFNVFAPWVDICAAEVDRLKSYEIQKGISLFASFTSDGPEGFTPSALFEILNAFKHNDFPLYMPVFKLMLKRDELIGCIKNSRFCLSTHDTRIALNLECVLAILQFIPSMEDIVNLILALGMN